MSEAFLAASARLALDGGPSAAPAAAAADALQSLLSKAGVPARRLGELHWLLSHGEDQTWLTPVTGHLNPDLAVFTWPESALLDHFVLQSAARSVQLGQRDLLVMGQFSPAVQGDTPSEVTMVLLASTAAIGRYNLAPRARIAALLALSATPDGLAASASAALRRLAERERAARKPVAPTQPSPPSSTTGQPFMNILPEMLPSGDLRAALPEQPQADQSEPEPFDYPTLEEIVLLAGDGPSPADLNRHFPNAKGWSAASQNGALRRLAELVGALESNAERWGVLLSSGPHHNGPLQNGLVTLIERT